MTKPIRFTLAAVMLMTASAASARPDLNYKDHVIETWCKHVKRINLLVFYCG